MATPTDTKTKQVFFLVYELDDRKTWQDPETWIQANPGLGTIKKIRSIKEQGR